MTLSDLKEHVARKKGNSRGMRGVLIRRLRAIYAQEDKLARKAEQKRLNAVEAAKAKGMKFGLKPSQYKLVETTRRSERTEMAKTLLRVRDCLDPELDLETEWERKANKLLHLYGWDAKFPTLEEELEEEEARQIVEKEAIEMFNKEREEEEAEREHERAERAKEAASEEEYLRELERKELEEMKEQERRRLTMSSERARQKQIKDAAKHPATRILISVARGEFDEIQGVAAPKHVFCELYWGKASLGHTAKCASTPGSEHLSFLGSGSSDPLVAVFPTNVDESHLLRADVYAEEKQGLILGPSRGRDAKTFLGRVSIPAIELWQLANRLERKQRNAIAFQKEKGKEKIRTLVVHVSSASDLGKADPLGSSDPYVEVFGSNTISPHYEGVGMLNLGQTSVVKNSLNPKWGKEATFRIDLQRIPIGGRSWEPKDLGEAGGGIGDGKGARENGEQGFGRRGAGGRGGERRERERNRRTRRRY